MYISRLSVHGYKNTCQKSVISLNKGLNILLGENGCGKTISKKFPVIMVDPIINAIQLWQKNEPSAQQAALNLLAYQLQKWLGTKGQKNNYYYSEEICSSPTTWRLLLRDILTAFCSQPSIINMDQTAYSAWYSANKKILIEIILHMAILSLFSAINDAKNMLFHLC